ncbi:MAG: hypothetical protein AAGE59_19135 [Cyanobacteria bacterium P01_F01_bin.86]
MGSTVALESQIIQNDVREVGINENRWYPFAWANQLREFPGKNLPIAVVL